MFYGKAVDPTMITSMSEIASQKSAPMKQVKKLLDYCASQEDAIMTLQKSDMKLVGHSDTGYLKKPKAYSRSGGGGFMSNSFLLPPNNGAVLTISKIIKSVMLSVVEAELCALFFNTKKDLHMRQILEDIGHKQDQTLMQKDNSTAEGVIKKRSNQNVPRAWI